MRVILIGGTSHAGKSTLGLSLAERLAWDYLATDSLARHPGRPWKNQNQDTVKKHVAQHYRNLSAQSLLEDVLLHYRKNVFPQVKAIVSQRITDAQQKCLVIEGSALLPELAADLVEENLVGVIYLMASQKYFRDHIFSASNFYSLGEDDQLLIQKFLARTILYDQIIREQSSKLDLTCMDTDSFSPEALLEQCLRLMEIDMN